ncbi:MAG TPA: hypothetical protein VFZ25_01250 [Chloroflexota bacterium]|nr:hypothetical protein [Chloroflexota bacterium]
MPTLPRADEYQLAIQSPALCFGDPELRQTRVDTDQLGLPRVASGGFALTYRLRGAGQTWAVRCFYKDVPDLQRRYDAISRFLQGNRLPLFVPVEYQQDGIRIAGRFQPIIKMPWVGGEPLGVYVESNLNDPARLAPLPDALRAVASQLRQLGVAHGDLQHGNIMVEQGQLRLIDYDGFYVPNLRGIPSSNLGHVNYQHPRRQLSDFGPDLDRFSAIVLYLGLRATALRPALWRAYATGENCLFSQADFATPDKSALLAELEQIAELRPLVERFRRVCLLSLADVPTLEEFLKARLAQPTLAPVVQPVPVPVRQQYPRLSTSNLDGLVRHLGQRVEVVGTVSEVAWKATSRGNRPYVFLSFGDWREKCFRLVIWDEALHRFIQAGIDPSSYARQPVSATGVVTVYRGTPQIVVDMPSEIRIVQQLTSPVPSQPTTAAPVAPPSPPKRAPRTPNQPPPPPADAVLNRLYGGYPQNTAATPATASPPKSVSPPKPRPSPPAKRAQRSTPARAAKKPRPGAQGKGAKGWLEGLLERILS